MIKKDLVRKGVWPVVMLDVASAGILVTCLIVMQLTGVSEIPWVRVYVVLGIMAVLFLILLLRAVRCPDCKRSVALSAKGQDTCPHCGNDWTQEVNQT